MRLWDGSVSPCKMNPGTFFLKVSYLACFSANGSFLDPSRGSPWTAVLSWESTNVAAPKWRRLSRLWWPCVALFPSTASLKVRNSSSVGDLFWVPQAKASLKSTRCSVQSMPYANSKLQWKAQCISIWKPPSNQWGPWFTKLTQYYKSGNQKVPLFGIFTVL